MNALSKANKPGRSLLNNISDAKGGLRGSKGLEETRATENPIDSATAALADSTPELNIARARSTQAGSACRVERRSTVVKSVSRTSATCRTDHARA